MEKHLFEKSKVIAILAVMFAMVANSAESLDWRKLMTIAEVKRDGEGKLLPLQSYDETIRRGMSFLLDDHLKWFKGPPDTLLDEQGRTQIVNGRSNPTT